MRDLSLLFSLPAGILTLLASSSVDAQELQWPYNLPRTLKYFPEDEIHIKRDFEIRQRLTWQAPAGIRKMSSDEGEKFWPRYWDFGEQRNDDGERPLLQDEPLDYLNVSLAPTILNAAIAPHVRHDNPSFRFFGRDIFARDYTCPANTTSCSSIGSDLCCPSGETCVSDSGTVGCCPSGETCGSTVAACDTTAGYTSCSSGSGGGCCVPGAACQGTGCVFYGTATQTVTATLTSSRATSTSSASTSSAATTTTAAAAVVTSGYTTTVTVTQSVSGQMTTVTSATTVIVVPSSSSSTADTTTAQSALTCSSSFISCAASLGGGCCPAGQICGTASLCLDPSTATTTATASAAILPTSVSTSASAVTVAAASASSTVTTDDSCPTGYYVCSAYYLGGCCRVGRNCDTTSCPSADSTAVVSSGATVVVAGTADSTAATTTGSCANGWFSCAASVGGGCCPSGLACGTASCTATASGESSTAKEAPSSASVVGCAWSFTVLAAMAGIGMIWL